MKNKKEIHFIHFFLFWCGKSWKSEWAQDNRTLSDIYFWFYGLSLFWPVAHWPHRDRLLFMWLECMNHSHELISSTKWTNTKTSASYPLVRSVCVFFSGVAGEGEWGATQPNPKRMQNDSDERGRERDIRRSHFNRNPICIIDLWSVCSHLSIPWCIYFGQFHTNQLLPKWERWDIE